MQIAGFNNLTKTVSFNLYDFFIARTLEERQQYVQEINQQYSASRISESLRKIAEIIDAEVLSISQQDYEPHGASSLVLMSDLGHTSVTAHLDKSHLSAHTYPDMADRQGICSFRVDIDISTCGTIVPLKALDFMFKTYEADVVIIDYVVRGFTRNVQGDRLYMDHQFRSITDFISPDIVQEYFTEDLILQNEKIWQTKLIRKQLRPGDYFPDVTVSESEEGRKALELLRREMFGLFHSWPNS